MGGEKQLAIFAYVPEDKKGKIDAREWMKKVVSLFQGEVVAGGDEFSCQGFITADQDKNKFPLEMKEPCITEAITYLKGLGLFPDHDSDDDDDYVFGDDDFPTA